MRDICELCEHFVEIDTFHQYPEQRNGKIRYCPILGQKIDGSDATYFIKCSRFELKYSEGEPTVPVEVVPVAAPEPEPEPVAVVVPVAEEEKTITVGVVEDKKRGRPKFRR